MITLYSFTAKYHATILEDPATTLEDPATILEGPAEIIKDPCTGTLARF